MKTAEEERPVEPYCIGENPERWAEIADWEAKRAEKAEASAENWKILAIDGDKIASIIAEKSVARIKELEEALEVAWNAMCDRRDYAEHMEWKHLPVWNAEDKKVKQVLGVKEIEYGVAWSLPKKNKE